MPLTALYLLLLFIIAIFLVALLQIGIITIAFDKLGLSPLTGMLILIGSLLGSGINIPLYHRTQNANFPPPSTPELLLFWGLPRHLLQGKSIIAVNLGGCVIPVVVSIYLLSQHPLNLLTTITALLIVTLVSYQFSRPIAGVGIGMPMFLAPVVSALTALLLAPDNSAPLAYISGTLGVLIGADLLRLRQINTLNIRVASIGGAGTFDGIFFTGIIAAFLA